MGWLNHLRKWLLKEPEDGFKFIPPKRVVNRVFIHCSASDNPEHDDISVITKWHKAKGWRAVGYHYFIKSDGTIQKGRTLEHQPAAQYPHNKGTIAFCLHGLHDSDFTKKQFKAAESIVGAINEAYHGEVTFHAHNEVSAKLCPVFDIHKKLNIDNKGNYCG